MFNILCSVLSVLFVGYVSGTCSWPDVFANTVWRDSSKGEITFTADQLSGWTITITGTQNSPQFNTWRCHSTALYESDQILLMITEDTFSLYGIQLYGYICLKLTEITQFSYRYYLYYYQESNADNERVAMRESNSEDNFGILCSLEDPYAQYRPADSEYRVMLKSSSLTSIKIDCPYVFLGSYDYSHTSSDGTVTCDSSANVMSSCTDSTEISFDYTTCPTKVAYSVSDKVWCVDNVPSGGINYVTVYNGYDADAVIDNVDVYQFACFAISEDGTTASIAPNSCRKDQTADAFPTSGGNNIGSLLALTKSTESCLTCPLVTVPDSGSVSYSTLGGVTSASYSCSSEYSLAGPETRICQSNNSWTDEDPTCTCIAPSVPANGSIVTSVDGTLTYSCDVGFVLNGDRTRECLTNSNTWSGLEPSCDPCEDITVTTGLNITALSTGTTTVSYFTCLAGYTLDGSSNSTCLSSGAWESEAPTCSLCNNITSTASMTVDVTTDGFTSTASFTCVTGYHIVGQSIATCDMTGAWSSMPTCECDEQAAPADGSKGGNGTNAQFSCDVGYNLIGSSSVECLDDGTGWSADPPSCDDCQTPGSLDGGYYNLSTDGSVTMATYSCNIGYTISGQRISHCQDDGSWNGTVPSCIKCPDLSDPSSGTVTLSTDGSTSVAVYACATGYDISVETTSTCLTDGTWTNSPPTCSCSPASVPVNGAVLSDNGEAVYYQCNLNYSMNGTSVRDCAADGSGWSDSDPICVQCETLVSVAGGSLVASTDGVNTKVEYSCDTGYTVNGKKEITCNSDGSWDSSQSSCTQCNALTSPSGGNFTMHSVDGTVTKATFTCDVGYVLDGYSELTCLNTGLWDNDVPECVECKVRDNPTSGNLTLQTDGQTTTGTYSCANGYEIVGQEVITCRIDGNWNYPSAVCKCLTPSAPSDGSVTADGDTVTFTCVTGFTMSGDSTGTCNIDGTGWSIATPECVQCESLVNFTSGNVTYSSDGSTTLVEYSCPEGSSLRGSSVVSCSESGSWETELPECVSCPTLPSVSVTTGSVTLVTNGTTTTAEYNCPQRYEIKGKETLTCNSDGTWNNDPSDCVCETPTIPEGGKFTVAEDGLSVSFTCGEGFTMVGEQTISCGTDGSGWTLEYPSCTKCENLTTPANGNITLVTSGTQTVAMYSCGVGYSLDGTAEPTCLSDGTWTTVEQTCVSCSEIPSVSITGGSVSLESNGTTTTAVYSCPDGYEVKGQETLTCNSSGSWDSSPSTCVCETPGIPDGGSYTMSEDGLSVTFACDEGYTIAGVQEITCSTDGSGWTVTFPNCTKCETVAAPEGGSLQFVTNGTQTLAVYTCGVNSSLNGVATQECNLDGTWQSIEPSCESCPSLPSVSIATGSVSFVTNGTTTTAEYICPPGYEVKGEKTLTCNSDGTWDNVPSDCVCETPSVPDGGNFTLSEDGLSALFTCEAGYTMQGVQTITCGTDGSGWAFAFPNCTKCEDLTIPTDGNITLTTTGSQTTAVYTCGVGFTLKGATTPSCQSDGTWTSVEQTCVSCPELPNVTITGGTVSLETNGTTTTAVYSCPDGYEIKGQETLTCNSSGTWDSSSSTCVCETPEIPVGGSYTLSGDGLSVIYACDKGYTLSGVQEVTCATDGSGWTITFPNCTQCDSILAPDGGNVTLVTNDTQTLAVYTCGLGSSLDGEANPECLEDGTWQFTEPICVTCPDLPNVTITAGNVTMVTDGTTTTAVYNCPPGYEVKGSQAITCTTFGAWSSSPSDCVCQTPDITEGGNFALSEDGLTATFMCEAGYTMVGGQVISCGTDGSGWNLPQPNCTKCEDVSTPEGGEVVLITSGTQTTAVYACEIGYTLDGQAAPECGTDGIWTAERPVCVSCPELANVTSASLNITTNGQTTKAVYTCDDGYEIDGNAIITCLTNGSWDSEPPLCFCEAPLEPLYGSVVSNSTAAVYSCDEGYILKGTSVRTCQENGQGWSGSAPSCTTCDLLSDPDDGAYTLTTNGTVTIATFICGVGFSMNGTQTLVCLDDGSWSENPPICVQCPTLVQPNSGSLMMSTDNVLTSALYTCSPGYYIVGEELLVCSSEGWWNASEPFCACNTLTAPDNGNVEISTENATATYTCDLGYSIDGVATRTCATDGSGWSGSAPYCVGCPNVTSAIDGNFNIITDGTVTSVNFQCDNGATIDGASTLTCQSDGTWTSVQPTCVVCPSLSEPSSGNASMETDGQTTTVTYTCANNYEIVGDATRECQTDGTWTGVNTTCVCAPPAAPVNGTVTLADDNLAVSYTCDLSFSLVGDSVRTCQADGLGWTGSDPSCVQCEALTQPVNGTVTTSTNGTHTISTFTCSLGTSMQGQGTSICQRDAIWSSPKPTCVSCPSLSDPSSGSVTTSTDGATTTAIYACANGYKIIGQNETTCQTDGTWSNSSPECVCEDPDSVANGIVSSDGREASFQCNTGYSLNGQSVLNCGANGSGWDDQAPECVKCLNISKPDSGNVIFTSTGINTLARFECDVGTSLNGSALLRCNAQGFWNGTEPYCAACDSIDSPANGVYTLSTDGATTSVQLQCNEGFQTTGETKIECGPDGKWTFSQESTCDKVEKKADSLLGVLIAVSVTSLVIITVLSLVLARFVYLYLQTRKKGGQYKTDIVPFDNFKRSKMDSYDDFPLAPVKLNPSAAPVNHQRHVLESGGPFSTSPAPQAFEDHVAGNGAVPFSPLPIETHRSGDSIISFRRSATTVTNKSLASVSEITIANANQKVSSQTISKQKSNGVPTLKNGKLETLTVPDMKSNRLSPIPNHKQMLTKLNQSSPRVPKLRLDSDGSQSPSQVRSSTPTVMKHSISVSNLDDKSFDSVSVVDA